MFVSDKALEGIMDSQLAKEAMQRLENASDKAAETKSFPPLRTREQPGPFPIDALPSALLAMTVNAADCVQVSHGMAACLALGAVSAAVVGRFSVRVGADYTEPCQLFIAVGARPSERKSACMELLYRPLYAYEEQENIRRAPEVKKSLEIRGMLEEGIARARKTGDRGKLEAALSELEGHQDVKPFELLLSDATPEALSRALARNDGRMALVSSEGAFLSILSGAYAGRGEANVDVVLKGYSGEPVRVERIGRAGERIQRANLSMCLAVQPDILEKFLNDPTLLGRGMASRFLVCLPESLVGKRSLHGVSMDTSAALLWSRTLTNLLNDEGRELPLSQEALAVSERWFMDIESELGPGGQLCELGAGWGGKLSGNTLRIAGLLTLMTPGRARVEADCMQSAVQIARWFLSHAKSLMAGSGDLSPEAEEMLRYLVRRGEGVVAATVVKNVVRKKTVFKQTDAFEMAMAELEREGYIQLNHECLRASAGRPTGPVIHLHPDLLPKTRKKQTRD